MNLCLSHSRDICEFQPKKQRQSKKRKKRVSFWQQSWSPAAKHWVKKHFIPRFFLPVGLAASLAQTVGKFVQEFPKYSAHHRVCPHTNKNLWVIITEIKLQVLTESDLVSVRDVCVQLQNKLQKPQRRWTNADVSWSDPWENQHLDEIKVEFVPV